MTDALIIQIMQGALWEVLIVSSPVLIVSVLVGLIISIFQASTSIQEQTLTFVPKIFAIIITLIVSFNWMMIHLKEYTLNLHNFIINIIK